MDSVALKRLHKPIKMKVHTVIIMIMIMILSIIIFIMIITITITTNSPSFIIITKIIMNIEHYQTVFALLAFACLAAFASANPVIYLYIIYFFFSQILSSIKATFFWSLPSNMFFIKFYILEGSIKATFCWSG